MMWLLGDVIRKKRTKGGLRSQPGACDYLNIYNVDSHFTLVIWQMLVCLHHQQPTM